jgi:hypothetical protein
MHLERFTARLEQNAQVIRELVDGLSDCEARWRPEPEAWSTLDVVNHLAYEEVHDFRDPLDLVLHRPEDRWPAAPSARGVTEDRCKRTLEDALTAFLAAREESLIWLKSLQDPPWDATCEAPFGPIKAGDVLAAWVAHDLLHLRQLTELQWGYLAAEMEPYRLTYAGRW